MAPRSSSPRRAHRGARSWRWASSTPRSAATCSTGPICRRARRLKRVTRRASPPAASRSPRTKRDARGGRRMAIIFQDFFEEEVETLLEHHTPDIGTGWSILFDSFTTAVVVVKPLGGAGEPYVVSPDTSNNGMGRAFALQPTPASADVAVEIDVFETDWSRANTYNRGLFARDTGGHTHYAVSILPNGNSQPSIRLFKTVAGSSDVIGSHDATLQNGDVIRFECYDASKRVLLNGVEVISVADNDIAGPGGAGLYWGNWNGQNGGGHPDRRSDIGFITVEAAQVGPVVVDLSAAPAGTATASAAVHAARSLTAQGGGQTDVAA